MATNIIHLQNLRSKDVLSGSSANLDVAKHFDGVTSPKLPTEEQLEYGDIALNIASDYETLAIKNIDGKIVYLPFNLTERLYTQELSLSAVKADLSNDIEKLNGVVVSDHDIISGYDANIRKLSDSVSALNITYNEVIIAAQNEISGQVSVLTSSLEELQTKEANDYSAITSSVLILRGSVDALNTQYNNEIKGEIDRLSEIVSAETTAYNALLQESEETQLVHAAAFEKFKTAIGLSPTVEYEPMTDFLSGSSIADAIDITNARVSQLDNWQKYNLEVTKNELQNQIETLSGAVDDKLSVSSGISVSACESKIDAALVNAKNYTKTTTAQLKQEIQNYSNKTTTELNRFNIVLNNNAATLSAETINRINAAESNLNDSIIESENKLSKSLEDKIQSISENLSGMITSQEDELRGDVIDIQDAFNVNIQRVDEAASNARQVLSGRIETVYSILSGKINANQTNNAAEHGTFEERLGILESASIDQDVRINVNSSNVESLKNQLTEDEYVRAFAIAKFRASIGLTENGEYEPYAEQLEGRTMTEAIDTIYDNTVSMEKNIRKDINSTLDTFNTQIQKTQSALTDSVKTLENADIKNYSSLKSYADSGDAKSQTELKNLIATTENKVNLKIATLTNTVNSNAALSYQRDTSIGNRIDAQKTTLENSIKTAQNTAVLSAQTMIDGLQASIQKTISNNEKSNNAAHEEIKQQVKELSGNNETLKEEVTAQINALSSKTGFFNEIIEPVQNEVTDLSAQTKLLSARTEALSAETIDINQDLAQDEYVKAKTFVRFNASLGFNENAEYQPSSENLSGMSVTEALDYFGDYVNILTREFNNVRESISDFNVQHVKTVTYEKLMGLLLTERLQWGQWYRISNYQATVDSNYANVTTRLKVKDSGSNTNSGFDILVRATSFGTLSEDAVAMPCEYDTYFDNSNVEGWKLKYCLFNDSSRFAWAKNNGFGVIYYMQDEFGNEANYDFKNIKFGGKFTFNSAKTNEDLSLVGKAYGNVINAYLDSKGRYDFNNIVISSNQIVGNEFQAGCYDIKITNNSFSGNQIAASYNNKSITKDMNYKLIGYSLA